MRLVEDDWEGPTLGAWGLGWEVWCDGMEVTQFTYFQQVGGIDLDLDPGGDHLRPRAAGHVPAGQAHGVRLEWAPGVTYGDVYRENERQWSQLQLRGGAGRRAPCGASTSTRPSAAQLLERGLPLPAYDQVLKCSHTFNLLDARGAISVTERAAYIGRVRTSRAASPALRRAETGACRRCCLRSAARSCPPPPAARPSGSCPSSARRALGAEPARCS